VTLLLSFRAQDSIATDVREFLKRLYDFIKSAENGLPFGDALPELIIQGFDEEQIWQELELQNEGRSKSLVAGVASVMAWEDLPRFPVQLNSRDRDSKDVNSEERDSRDVNSEERDSKDVKSEERDSRDVNSEDDWKLWIDEVDGSFTSASENKEDDMEPAFRKWEG